ncbi:hypothetical protein SOP94_05365 [Peribacillus frigoritolerans]|uniref:hypothetical protein n=1 Tax=Peribacillus frigoritolerans TaxID=450367 RepID=UPI002B2539B7|nr:hypothetical protein [Peribacillus frigoritolerans]MEB2627881.1 hypothetical protein [Peribacillus frigoritolerans]
MHDLVYRNAGISDDKLEKKASLTAVFYLKNVSVDFRNPIPFRLLSAKPHQSGCGVRLASKSAGVSQICSIQ